MGRGARNLASPICGAAACFDFPRTPNAREPPGFDDPILHGQKRFVYCKPGYMPGSENRSVAPTPRDPLDKITTEGGRKSE